MKLNVNLIVKNHFFDAGVDVPQHLIPVCCIKKLSPLPGSFRIDRHRRSAMPLLPESQRRKRLS